MRSEGSAVGTDQVLVREMVRAGSRKTRRPRLRALKNERRAVVHAAGRVAAERVQGVLNVLLCDLAGVGEPVGDPGFERAQDGGHVVLDRLGAAGPAGGAFRPRSDHPRRRGVDWAETLATFSWARPSPQARGRRELAAAALRLGWSIPAGAGPT